jgi:hypothetical protein
MIEKFWAAIGPMPLTAPGTTTGRLTVASTEGLRVKMVVTLTDPSFDPLRLEIKRVISATQFDVGEIGKSISHRADVSAFGISSSVRTMEQGRNSIPENEIDRATYEEEPVVARRVIGVDTLGRPWTKDNPLPVDAEVNVEVNVALDAFTPTPDSVLPVGSIDGTKTGTKYGFVNNRRQQILDSHDRVAAFTYSDFGTKNQRVTQIDYTSATFPGITVRRQFSYSLVGNFYRRDSETWTIV